MGCYIVERLCKIYLNFQGTQTKSSHTPFGAIPQQRIPKFLAASYMGGLWTINLSRHPVDLRKQELQGRHIEVTANDMPPMRQRREGKRAGLQS